MRRDLVPYGADSPCEEIAGPGVVSHDGGCRTAHSVVFEKANGPIPDGHEVYHRCMHPKCVRLDHLFLGPARANEQEWLVAAGLPLPTDRLCNACHQIKPLDDFPRRGDYRRHECIRCRAVRQAAQFQKNKEQWRPTRTAWYVANLAKSDFTRQRSRARKAGATEFMSEAEWADIRSRTLCHWCGIALHPSFTNIDHVRPLAWGGQHTFFNVVPACANCNQRREWERKTKYGKEAP